MKKRLVIYQNQVPAAVLFRAENMPQKPDADVHFIQAETAEDAPVNPPAVTKKKAPAKPIPPEGKNPGK